MGGEEGAWGEFVMFVEETRSEEEDSADEESKINKFIEDVQNLVSKVASRAPVAKEAAKDRAFKEKVRKGYEEVLALRGRVAQGRQVRPR